MVIPAPEPESKGSTITVIPGLDPGIHFDFDRWFCIKL